MIIYRTVGEIIHGFIKTTSSDGFQDSQVIEVVMKAWRDGVLGLEPDDIRKPIANRNDIMNKALQDWRDNPSVLRSSLEQEQFYGDSSPETKRLMEQNLEQTMWRTIEEGIDEDVKVLVGKWVTQYLNECEPTAEDLKRHLAFVAKYGWPQ